MAASVRMLAWAKVMLLSLTFSVLCLMPLLQLTLTGY